MKEHEQDFSLKRFFVPLTTFKSLHILVIVGIIVYANMLFNGFVWDDVTYIIGNPDVHSFNIGYLFGPNLYNSFGYYRPIAAVYFAFFYSLFQQQVYPYHIVQLVLHIGNTVLVFLFLKKFFAQYTSLFLSLLFLVHPMQVESVSYIASADNVLFFTFGMAALFILSQRQLTKLLYGQVFVLLLVSLLVKESGVMFLLFGLLYCALFVKKRLKKMSILFFGALTSYLLIRFSFVGFKLGATQIIPIAAQPLSHRIFSMPLIFLY